MEMKPAQLLHIWISELASIFKAETFTGDFRPFRTHSSSASKLHLVAPLPELGSYLYMDASLKTEQQRARLASPAVAADTGPLCLLFSYQLAGEAQGQLRVLLRDAHNEEAVLWMLRDDQGPVWKEGRTILPRSPKDFQVAINLPFFFLFF